MNTTKSPTPETDAFIKQFTDSSMWRTRSAIENEIIGFARKLERERDEESVRADNLELPIQGQTKEINQLRKINTAQGEYDIVLERDELRKVCDELAKYGRELIDAQCALGLARLMRDDPKDIEALKAAEKLPSVSGCFEWIRRTKVHFEKAIADHAQLPHVKAKAQNDPI